MDSNDRVPNGDEGIGGDVEIPVLIVGAGPSGATTALLLGKLGIASIAISRHQSTANTPRAHIFNQRAMEVLRDAGLEDSVWHLTSPTKDMMHTSWLRSLTGEEYGRRFSWGTSPDRIGDYEKASPCKMSDLPQSRLEPVLVDQAKKAGAEFRFHTEFVSQQSLSSGEIETTVRHRPSEKCYKIKSRYLIGADGARSKVLESLDIPIDGKQINTAFNVHIKADLTRYLAHRPGTLNWILNPDAPEWSAVGNMRMVSPWDEFVVSMHPASTDGKEFEPTEKDILRRLRQMIGNESVDIEILSTFRWSINDQVARTYQKGNVICIGDAVHRHPPINGLGSNTCISDAMNLSWKLAYALKGWAGPKLLDSVTIERKPVGDGVVRRANTGMEAHRALWGLLGLSQDEREASTALMEQATAKGADLRRKVSEAFEKFDKELQALGIQMNQIYTDSPLTVVESDDKAPDFSHLDLLFKQAVTAYPGYHLPHVWVAKDSQSFRVSTLDLVGRGGFTLLTGIGGGPWRKAAEAVSSEERNFPLRTIAIGWRQDYMDAYGDWEKIRGVEDDGVVLVRPDHFVAWRCKTLPDDPKAKLLQAIRTILHTG